MNQRKVKIFYDIFIVEAEEKINTWINQNPSIYVIETSMEIIGNSKLIVTLLYEEMNQPMMLKS